MIGFSSGIDTITYTLTVTCGTTATVSATTVITVNPVPDAGAVAGADLVCVGDTISLTDAAPGGTWTSANGSAFVSSSGIVLGLSIGADTIMYTVTNACGTDVAEHPIIVHNCITNVESVNEQCNIKVYPNPTNNEVFIDANDKIGALKITNTLGQEVFDGYIDTRTTAISLRAFPSGVYFINARDRNFKIIKE